MQGSGCEINASHTQGCGCDINASHTQGSGCEINASHTMARPRASRSSSHREERREACRVWHAYLGTSGGVTPATQLEFLNQSQLVLYRLLFISFRLFHGTLEPRVIVQASISHAAHLGLSPHSAKSEMSCLFSSTRLREQRFFHAGERLRKQRLSHAGERLRNQRLSQWTDRGHHVPALTVASGGRGVGFDMHAW